MTRTEMFEQLVSQQSSELDRLRAENARLREALRCIRELADNDTGDFRVDLIHCAGVAEAALANETDTTV